MQFMVRGQPFEVTVENVLERTEFINPAPLVRYAVELHGRWYPPKQVMSLVTGLPVAAFTTQDAYRIMQRLGLSVVEASAISNNSEKG